MHTYTRECELTVLPGLVLAAARPATRRESLTFVKITNSIVVLACAMVSAQHCDASLCSCADCELVRLTLSF